MNTRLTLEERGQVAISLRQVVLEREHSESLELISDPNLQPIPESMIGIYAFEFFLDRCRQSFHEYLGDFMAYNVMSPNRWLMCGEQTGSANKTVRMSVSFFMTSLLKSGDILELIRFLQDNNNCGQSVNEMEKFDMFVYEIVYELVYELFRKLAKEIHQLE